jgi:rhamnosyltransferase
MKPECSIVIRAYNEQAHIGRLLTGITQQTLQDVQIILVDSGSTDGTLEIARNYPVEVVSIRPQDFSFGRSLNLGIQQAAADFIVIASAHVYPVYPDWLENLLKPLARAQVALTYGKQRGNNQSHFSEQQIFAHWYPEQPRPQQKHPFCNNANAAIRRSLWNKRPYDENLSGLEDLEWARWAQEGGHAIMYVPEAEVIHVHQETWAGIYNRYRREAMAFKQIYPQENFRFAELVRLWLVNAYNDLRTARRQSKMMKNLKGILVFRWMQFWGTYQGYRQSGSLTWDLKRAFYYPHLPEGESGIDHRRHFAPIRYDHHSTAAPANHPSGGKEKE